MRSRISPAAVRAPFPRSHRYEPISTRLSFRVPLRVDSAVRHTPRSRARDADPARSQRLHREPQHPALTRSGRPDHPQRAGRPGSARPRDAPRPLLAAPRYPGTRHEHLVASSISPCCSPHQHSPRTRDRYEQLTQGLSAGLLSPTTLDLNSSASVMEVSHGGEAGMVWDHMVRGNSSPEEKETPEGCTARLLQAGHAGDGQSA
jgi:hypothetical protein